MEKFYSQEDTPDILRHLCMVPRVPRVFTPRANGEILWDGKPSVVYGLIRTLAFRKRKENPSGYLRILFGEGGRKSVPWGALWYELNGNVYQFGAGINRYPGTCGSNGKGVSEEGLRLLGQGIIGEMTVDDADFRWIQDEIDVTPLFSPETISDIQNIFEKIMLGIIPAPVYQSRMRAQKFGFPLREDSQTCTTFIGNILNRALGIPFPEFMPLDLFEKTLAFVKKQVGDECSALDCQLNRLLWITERDLNDAFLRWAPDLDLDAIARGKTDPPAYFSWDALLEKFGVQACG